MFGLFFFLTLFLEGVWAIPRSRPGSPTSRSARRLVTTAVAVRPGLADRPRSLLLAGSALATGGLIWLSRIVMHSSYAGGLLGPMLVAAAGFGLHLVPLNMTGLSRIRDAESGVAFNLLTTGQQVGETIPGG